MLPILKVCGTSRDYRSPARPRPSGSQPQRRRQKRRLRPAAQEPPVVLNFSMKMADPTFADTSNRTSFRGLRERLVAVAQELAEERRRKRGIDSSAVTNRRSSCTPVIDGSVLKNDIKQQLAKERREERKRLQEANKEKQLLEKEQKAKLLYEKQLEEKHRKLKEQKEKDEQRRASAEEKRKQKQAEDKEKFKAVVSRTIERCNRIEQQQKRWLCEGGVMNTDKSGKPENKQSSSLNKKDNQLHQSCALEHVGDTPGMTKHVFRYVTVPMFTSDELKSSTMFHKPSEETPVAAKLEITPTEELETPLKGDVEGPAMVNIEIPPKITVEVPSPTKLEEPPDTDVEVRLQNMEDISEVKVDVSHNMDIQLPTDENIATCPISNVEELPSVSVDTSSSIEPCPTVNEDSSPSPSMGFSSIMSMEVSPFVSMDVSLETSIDTSPELSMDSRSVEVASEVKTEAPLQASGESHLEASVEGQPEVNVEGSPKNPEMDKRNINLTTKKQSPCHIPCYRWPSSPTLRCRPPSPLKALRQNRKMRPSTPLPVSTRLSTKTSLSYTITPVQNILYVPNALGIVATKKETIQKHMMKKEAVNTSMPSGEMAKKALIQVPYAAYEQKDKKKERVQEEETKPSIARSEVITEELDKVPAEESSPCEDEEHEKDPIKTLLESPEDQKEQLQKGDSAMMKSQDSAEQRKKEQENIMLQDWQERLERRKAEISSSEDEADDEGETGSDDSFEMSPSGGKMFSLKLKKFHKYAKMKPQKLVFLQAGTGEVDAEKNVYFNENMKAVRQKDPRYSTIQGRGSKLPARRPPARPMRSRKIKEGSTAIRPTQSVTTNQEWLCDGIIDFSQTTESPVLKTTLDSTKQSPMDSKTSRQGPRAHLDHKKRANPVSAPLTKVLSHLHIAGRASNLEHPFASSYSKLAFQEEVEESDV